MFAYSQVCIAIILHFTKPYSNIRISETSVYNTSPYHKIKPLYSHIRNILPQRHTQGHVYLTRKIRNYRPNLLTLNDGSEVLLQLVHQYPPPGLKFRVLQLAQHCSCQLQQQESYTFSHK